jgi:Pyruvate/2-oxoacid:ferredoxin oxidoreductase delta subunit
VPVNKTLNSFKHAILPYAEIDEIVNRATVIAVVNCNCRVMSRIKGREPCQHPLDVCIKYDELAEYVIDVGIGRRVSKDEAKAVNKRAEEAGCVHFSDNVVDGGVKHTCNCCPCCCWSLGTFKRRRVPRDLLMACQFIRETDLDNCIGCEACAEACPIEAVVMQDDLPHVDMDWCIGCGVCASSCPNGAISMVRRAEVPDPFPDLRALHGKRLEEKVPAKEPET